MSATTPAPVSDAAPWTTRAIFARHKRLALATIGIVVVMAILLAAAVLSSSAGAVSDRTTCSAWSSANQDQQQAYAALYVREHGAPPHGTAAPASVLASINRGCMQSFGSDAADLVTVYEAINNQY